MFRLSLVALLVLLAAPFSCDYPDVESYIQAEEVLRWEPAIHRFDSLNAIEDSDETTLLVTGSSSVRLWDGVATDLAPYKVMQRGYGGAKLSDYNYYAKRIIKAHRFKGIVVFIANDIHGGDDDRSPEEVLALFRKLSKQIREQNGRTPVLWVGITPTPYRWEVWPNTREANELIKAYCKWRRPLHFIPTEDLFIGPDGLPDSSLFRADMLHLNADGYRVWAERIKEGLAGAGIEP
ncbi:MAG: hypothetical protein CSA96_06050 [Bacteroidetes bacterium]|nr:MAG: hypothetical protein CSA96_06050 [Bacteroidota bacterium]